jgi:hypothetical protein
MLRLLIASLFSSIGSIITALIPLFDRVSVIQKNKKPSVPFGTGANVPDFVPALQLIHYTQLNIGQTPMPELLTLLREMIARHPELPGLLELERVLISETRTPGIISTSHQEPKT